MRRVFIVGRDKPTRPRILTGRQATHKNITLRRIETVWLSRPTPVITIRSGPLSSVVIAGISYASVKMLVLKLAGKGHCSCPIHKVLSVTL